MSDQGAGPSAGAEAESPRPRGRATSTAGLPVSTDVAAQRANREPATAGRPIDAGRAVRPRAGAAADERGTSGPPAAAERPDGASMRLRAAAPVPDASGHSGAAVSDGVPVSDGALVSDGVLVSDGAPVSGAAAPTVVVDGVAPIRPDPRTITPRPTAPHPGPSGPPAPRPDTSRPDSTRPGDIRGSEDDWSASEPAVRGGTVVRERAKPPAAPPRRRRGRRVAIVAIAIVVIVAALAAVGIRVHTVESEPVAARGPAVVPAGAVLPVEGSTAALPTAAGLAAVLAKPLRDARLGGHVSFAVSDLSTGKMLYGKGASSPTVPASSMKLATTTALLALRGPDYRITTRVVAGAKPGEVVIVGAGDPTLGATANPTYPESGRLDVLADQVKRALGRVKPTKVIYDVSIFSGSSIGPDWLLSDVNGRYIDRIYALAADGGRTDPAKIGASKRYPNSAIAAADTFAKYLGLPATAVSLGRAPAAPSSTASPTRPGAVLGSVQSAPIVRIIETMLATSDNVLAEFMARQVAIASGKPASFAGASEAVTDELRKLGMPLAGVHIVDGSGLSTDNRLTPALLTSILSYDAQPAHTSVHALFTGMPVAGYSGTLKGRFRSTATIAADGLIRAKTGSLTGVSALAGVVIDSSGRPLAFALMMDKIPWGKDAPAAADVVGAALFHCGCG